MNWPFPDPPEVAVFTNKMVLDGDWIHYVSHDEDDGAWQFHSIEGAPSNESDARIVLLRNILKKDPTLTEIANLPLGWIAWRNSKESPWNRRPQTPPT